MYNDLWKYDLSSNLWELLNDTQSLNWEVDEIADHAMVLDSTDTNIYIFAGFGKLDGSTSGIFGDMVNSFRPF